MSKSSNPQDLNKNPGIMRTPLGEFQIGKTLGEGSYGKVKQITNIKTQEKLAVKIIKRFVPADAKGAGGRGGKTFEQRILREANLTRFLNHRSIVPLKDCRITKSHFYLFYECVSGSQLTDKIGRQGLSLEKSQKYFSEIVEAIGYCHQNFVVHRDIKVENIMVTHDDSIKIIDFGLANFYDEKNNLKTFCGSLQYSAPEIMKGDPYIGPEVDIWSLGVVLFAMLTGTLPFDDPRSPGAWENIMKGKIKFPTSISNVAKSLISQCLDSNTKRRIKMEDIFNHPFLADFQPKLDFSSNRNMPLKLNMEIVTEMTACLFQSEFTVLSKLEAELKAGVKNGDYVSLNNSPMVSVYHLIEQSKNKSKKVPSSKKEGFKPNECENKKEETLVESEVTKIDNETKSKVAKRINKFASVKNEVKEDFNGSTVKDSKRRSMFETYKDSMTKEQLKESYKAKRASIYGGIFNSQNSKPKDSEKVNEIKSPFMKSSPAIQTETPEILNKELDCNKSPFLTKKDIKHSPVPSPLADVKDFTKSPVPTKEELKYIDEKNAKSLPQTLKFPERIGSKLKSNTVSEKKKKVTFSESTQIEKEKTRAMDIFSNLDKEKMEIKDFFDLDLKLDLDSKIDLPTPPIHNPDHKPVQNFASENKEEIPGVRKLTVLECLKLNVLKISKNSIEQLMEEVLDKMDSQNIQYDWPDLKSVFVLDLSNFEVFATVEFVLVNRARSSAIILSLVADSKGLAVEQDSFSKVKNYLENLL